jgi:pyrimidine 5'-nucleotidase
MMVIKIHQYFTKHLKISDEEAERLHQDYYKSYGLALEGLVRHHKIGAFFCVLADPDPLAYNREVDDTLELDEILKPSSELHELLSSLDRTKVKPWILTNAYITHAKRVMKLLKIEHFFEGIRILIQANQALHSATILNRFSSVNQKRECTKRQ